jgi:glucokinase
VVAAAAAGEEAARAILDEVGIRLGQGIAGLVNVLDPSLVIVGGGPPAAAGDLLLEPARRACREAIEAADARPEVPIVQAALGADSAAVGAALWAMQEAA